MNLRARGEAFFAHYEHFLGFPADDWDFDADAHPDLQAIRVFRFAGVFDDAELQTYATFGFSRLDLALPTEVVLVVSGQHRFLVQMLARTLFHFAENGAALQRGVTQRGFVRFNREFCSSTGKTGFYFTDPWQFPDEFNIVHVAAGLHGRVLAALPISDAEFDFVAEHGFDAFEDRLEATNVDLLSLARPDAL
jgi:antitoxin YqcF